MCGLVGRLAYADGPEPPADDTERPLLALAARRGPDDEGYWSDRRGCVLGLRRLSILDVSPAGHQPMCSADGRYVLVYNGELYNFPALRAELARGGARFRSRGDTQGVLQA